MINFLEGKTEITDIDQLKPLEDIINDLAEKTEVRWLPAYNPVKRSELLDGVQKVSSSLSHLNEYDKASYISPDGVASFNISFNLTPESMEDLLTQETITSENEMILRVKKPDYLGESMWEFRHGNRNFLAKVSHLDWITRFQSREFLIRPGDSIRAIVRISDRYDFSGELTGTIYDVIEVKDVINMPEHEQLSFNDKSDDTDAKEKG